MSDLAAMFVGFGGTVLACAFAAVLYGGWGERHLPEWTGSFGVLLAVLAVNVSGWLIALFGVSS